MGILDSNKVLTTPKTGLEGSKFELTCSNDAFDMWTWRNASVKGADNGAYLRVTYRDYYVWTNNDTFDSALFITKGKPTDTPIRIEIDDTNFPGLRKNINGKYPYIVRAFVAPVTFTFNYGDTSSDLITNRQSGGKHCRIIVLFDNGQIYHNYPRCYNGSDFYNDNVAYRESGKADVLIKDLMTVFRESCVWDLPTRLAPVDDEASELIGKGYYYNPALPANNYEMHPAVGTGVRYGVTEGAPAYKLHDGKYYPRFWRTNMDSANSNSLRYMGGYAMDEKYTMIATYNPNKSSTPCRTCVFATDDGGENWYCNYEFAASYTRVKEGDNIHIVHDTTAVQGINLAVTASINPYWDIRRRIIIVPCDIDKEPEDMFVYDGDNVIISIVGTDSGITVTTASAHGYTTGDVVVVSGEAKGSPLDFMLNNTATSTSGGNGVLFIIQKIDDISFAIQQYYANPDSNLPARHIHCLNKNKDGVAVGCGESYPQGWIIFGAIHKAEGSFIWHAWDENDINWVRLNSTAGSLQRPLGVILKPEHVNGVADTMVYFGSDNATTPMYDAKMPEGRTETFRHTSTGVYKCPLSGFDDMLSAECIFPEKEVAYLFQEVENAMVFTGQWGALAISYDKGKTWTRTKMARDIPVLAEYAQLSGITDDRKFSIGNTLIQLKK